MGNIPTGLRMLLVESCLLASYSCTHQVAPSTRDSRHLFCNSYDMWFSHQSLNLSPFSVFFLVTEGLPSDVRAPDESKHFILLLRLRPETNRAVGC